MVKEGVRFPLYAQNFIIMKVEIIDLIWGLKVGEKVDLPEERANFAILRGRAKAIDVEYQKKVVDNAPKNKAKPRKKRKPASDFVGHKNMK